MKHDVAIIGAGYAGLACAIELHKHGVDCILLEAEQPGTGASTAIRAPVSGCGKANRQAWSICRGASGPAAGP